MKMMLRADEGRQMNYLKRFYKYSIEILIVLISLIVSEFKFLVYVMQKNWKDAHKLCKFILMYEPNNATAKEFLPLIEQKLELNESDTSGEETDDDDDDDDSDEDSDSDDSDDDSDSTSDESDGNFKLSK